MRIVIETDGFADNTKIYFNGKEQKTLSELNLSIKGGRKVKAQLIRRVNGVDDFNSYFGDDFKKYDEVSPEENL